MHRDVEKRRISGTHCQKEDQAIIEKVNEEYIEKQAASWRETDKQAIDYAKKQKGHKFGRYRQRRWTLLGQQ
ncbi:MAG: hypothetical protein A4E65_03206 [Syntrophorhabdus sp. PtaU1.Bin153]|nr:MAG: hypothetical protein A4E65_03206 [Syntrophorhabdus sp. PtaU1.Bin153]